MGSSGAGKSTLTSLFGEFNLEAKLEKKIGYIIEHQNV
jgi:ABC-type thiamine transport system ATPase subunit